MHLRERLIYVLGHTMYTDVILWHQQLNGWGQSSKGAELLYDIEVKLV